jgi:hypothetical protein
MVGNKTNKMFLTAELAGFWHSAIGAKRLGIRVAPVGGGGSGSHEDSTHRGSTLAGNGRIPFPAAIRGIESGSGRGVAVPEVVEDANFIAAAPESRAAMGIVGLGALDTRRAAITVGELHPGILLARDYARWREAGGDRGHGCHESNEKGESSSIHC